MFFCLSKILSHHYYVGKILQTIIDYQLVQLIYTHPDIYLFIKAKPHWLKAQHFEVSKLG